MRSEQPPTVRLSEYAPPAHQIAEVSLVFKLHPTATRVISTLKVVDRKSVV